MPEWSFYNVAAEHNNQMAVTALRYPQVDADVRNASSKDSSWTINAGGVFSCSSSCCFSSSVTVLFFFCCCMVWYLANKRTLNQHDANYMYAMQPIHMVRMTCTLLAQHPTRAWWRWTRRLCCYRTTGWHMGALLASCLFQYFCFRDGLCCNRFWCM